MRRRFWGFMMAVVMLIGAGSPEVVLAENTPAVVYVSESGDDTNNGSSAATAVRSINKALELAEEGSIIYVNGSVYIAPLGGTDDPLVIDKSITIAGIDTTNLPTVNVRTGGVILGADVTFKNIKYAPESYIRPGIAANGHTLTLINVHQNANARPLQIYGGTLYDITESIDFGVSYAGTSSEVNIIGGSYQAVYAGSVNGSVTMPVSIQVSKMDSEKSYSLSLGGIFAGGVQKISTSEAGSIPTLTDAYTVGVVDLTLSDVSVATISGMKAENDVSLTVGSQDLYSCAIDNIDNLTVTEGVFAPTGSWNSDINVALSGGFANKATLDLSGYTQALEMQDFTDNGALNILVLPEYAGEDASLIINGTHSGTTELRTAGGMPWGSEDYPGCSGLMEYEHTYVMTAGGEGSFVIVNPYSVQGWYDENGVYSGIFMNKTLVDNMTEWTTSAEEEGEVLVELISFAIVEEEIVSTYEEINEGAKQITLDVEFTEDSLDEDISFVPITYEVTYGEDTYSFTTNEEVYIYNIEELNLCLDAYATVLYVGKISGDGAGDVAAGEYTIQMTVPTITGVVTDSFVLVVHHEEGTLTPSPSPTPTVAPTAMPTEKPNPSPTSSPTVEPGPSLTPEELATTQVRAFVERMYTEALGRESDPVGISYWTTKLLTYESDGAGISQGFILSPEFLERNYSNDKFIQILYKTFMNREPENGGVEYWLSILNSGKSREYVLAGFVNSNEFYGICQSYGISPGYLFEDGSPINPGIFRFAQRLYSKVLEREGEKNGVEYWALKIASRECTPEDAAKGFFESDEYIAKQTGHEKYIQALYQTFMDREAEQGGLQYWINELNRGVNREEVLSRFAQSREFGEIMNEYERSHFI